MKKYSAFIFYLLFAIPQLTTAQAAILAMIFGDKVASEKFNLSMEVGVPFNSFSNVDDLKIQNGINFGIAGNLKLSENWYVSPTVYFLSKRTVILKHTNLISDDAYLNSLYSDTSAKMRLNYTDIHVLFSYQLSDSNFRFGLSPQVSFFGKSESTYSGPEGELVQNTSKFVNKTDYGVIANVGYYLKSAHKGRGIILNLRYYQGFTDVLKNDFASGDNKSNYVALHVSLPFLTDELASKNLKPINK
ncbi:PorT family protein [Formosa sediminum]|uniref:PorT family protein n=1 Tax=Formosa sediminum TaxID=2594004 RepID=A0A516GV93_9FLAO|nr:porin family protein [Formosa sediminum]QDO95444.1 PorT family protein [Formosa sediminum]